MVVGALANAALQRRVELQEGDVQQPQRERQEAVVHGEPAEQKREEQPGPRRALHLCVAPWPSGDSGVRGERAGVRSTEYKWYGNNES